MLRTVFIMYVTLVSVLAEGAKARTDGVAGPDALVEFADTIVRGRVTELVPAKESQFRYGRIQVTEVIYGPSDEGMKSRLLVLNYMGQASLTHDVGDEGIFFLRKKPLDGLPALTARPARSVGELRHMPFDVFVTDLPQACWAANDAFYERNKHLGVVKPSPKEQAAREEQMYRAVRARLEREIEQQTKVLEQAKQNLARVASRDRLPEPATRPEKRE